MPRRDIRESIAVHYTRDYLVTLIMQKLAVEWRSTLSSIGHSRVPVDWRSTLYALPRSTRVECRHFTPQSFSVAAMAHPRVCRDARLSLGRSFGAADFFVYEQREKASRATCMGSSETSVQARDISPETRTGAGVKNTYHTVATLGVTRGSHGRTIYDHGVLPARLALLYRDPVALGGVCVSRARGRGRLGISQPGSD